MILEAFKIVTSVFPLLKEAFLWRDGAEEGKPITRQNLIRRKIAVFALLSSLLFNYFITGKAIDLYRKATAAQETIVLQKEEIKSLNGALTTLKKETDNQVCMTADKVYQLMGSAVGNCPPAKTKSKSKGGQHMSVVVRDKNNL